MEDESPNKKRSAEEADIKEDEDDEQPSSPKRSSTVAAADEDDDDDAGEEEQSTEQQQTGDSQNDDDDEEERVEANDDAEEEIEEEEEMDQDNDDDDEVVVRRKIVNKFGKPAEAGVIKTIYVENFMCHQKLKVELCRNVNFINGQNGSGKSAILAAIQICLGAGARRTHRARNIKDLVRKESAGNNPSTTAKVRVTLRNEGGDGYRQDLYGDSITIERSISLRGGYNGYKLYSAEGKEVSRSKKDLDELLDHLNIQVENPVAILDQEEAKKFLKGKASEKYNFFLKATELDRIDNTFRHVQEERAGIDGKREKLSDTMESQAAKVKVLKEKLDQFKAVEKLEAKRLNMESGFAWAFFGERDQDYQAKLTHLEALKEKAASKKLELTQVEEEASGASDSNEKMTIEERRDELTREAKSQAMLKRELEQNLKEANQPVKALEREMKTAEKLKKTAEKTLHRAKQRLKDARAEQLAKAGSAESEEARRTMQLAETEEALAQEKSARDENQQKTAESHRDYEESEPEYLQAKETTQSKKKLFDRIRRQVQDLQSSSTNDPIAVFGQAASRLHKLVENTKRQGKFSGEVLGPIGAFIKIAPGKETYAELAENCLGFNTLDRFIVTNSQDRKLCESLRAKVGCRKECGLFQVSVSPRFIVPPPPADDIETVASVLSVTNDIVYNCLVDNARIDQRALAPSKKLSEDRLLITDSNGRYKIKGIVNEVSFLPEGDKWNVRDGAVSLQSNDKRSRERTIGVDRTRAIAEKEKELAEMQEELKEAQKAEREIDNRRYQLKSAWNDNQKAQRKNKDKIRDLQQKKEAIEVERETTASTTLDTADFEEDVEQAEEALEALKGKDVDLQKKLEDLQPTVEDARAKVEEIQTRNEKVLADMRDVEDRLESCIRRMTQNESQLQKKREKLKKYEDVVSKQAVQVDKAEEERDNALLTAKKLALRNKVKQEQADAEANGTSQELFQTQDFTEEDLEGVEIMRVDKDSKSYEAKITRLSTKIELEKDRRALSHEDPAEAMEKYFQERATLVGYNNSLDELATTEKMLDDDLRERTKKLKRLRKHLARTTENKFDQILLLNNSSGEIDFDEERGELNLMVQKNKDDPSSQTKDVKSLSGGERSYTTISLLLALGESLETPFRVLDEFDVFLDTQARKLTISTLIHVAKQMEHRQFIFITPQDLSSVNPEPDRVKIFKMKPPQRGQQAGGPTQQTLNFTQG